MRLSKRWTNYTAAALAAVLLVACGGGGGVSFVPQFNVTEHQLYEPRLAPDGVVVQRGSGWVSLQLEHSSSVSGLPMGSDTDTVGSDQFYFDLPNSGVVSLNMTPKMLQVIEAVELYDANNVPLFRVDAAHPVLDRYKLERTDFSKPAPRFRLRVVAAQGAISSVQILAWFGESLSPTANRRDLGQLKLGAINSCAQCNLSGAALGDYKWEDAYLPGADLRNASLVKMTDPSALSQADQNLFTLLWDSSQITGVKMNRSYLAGVDFTGAMVTGAGQSPAEFEAAHLYDAKMTGLNLDGVNMKAAFMDRAQLVNASMIESKLNKAQLVDTNFSGSDLRGAKFNDAMLTGTNFSRANLQGADFTNALVSGVNFTGAILDGARWTDGVKICATPSVGSCQ